VRTGMTGGGPPEAILANWASAASGALEVGSPG
jgi:hypothetical protein